MRREIRPFVDHHIPQMDSNRVRQCHVTLNLKLLIAFGVSAISFWWFCSFQQFCFSGFVLVVLVVLLALIISVVLVATVVSFRSFLVASVVSFWWFDFAISGFSTCQKSHLTF